MYHRLRKRKKHMEPTANQTPNYTPPVHKNAKALAKTRLLIIIGVVALIIVSGVFISGLIKKNDKPNVQMGLSEGVFTSFYATAIGKVSRISNSDIEIEDKGIKKSFKLSENLLITHKSLFDRIAGILISDVEAQAIPPRPNLPPEVIDTKTATGSGVTPNIPPAPRKELKEIKVGDLVSLNLTKDKENSLWIVTGISTLP